MIVLALILIAIVALLVYIEVNRLILSKKYKHIPGVPEWPIIGTSYALRKNIFTDLLLLVNDICFAPITKLFLGHKLVFIISDPQAMKSVLSGTDFSSRPYFLQFTRRPLSVLNADYDTWKPLRKALQPAFSQKTAISFLQTFEKHYKKLTTKIEDFIGTEIELYEFSVKILSDLSFETNFGCEKSDFDPELLTKIMQNINIRIFNPQYHLDFLYEITDLGKQDVEMDKTYDQFFKNILKQRKVGRKSKNENPIFIDEIVKYVEENNFKNDQLLMDNLEIVLAASYDTIDLTLSSAILMLAMHPEFDHKLQQEIKEINYEPGMPITEEILGDLVYLEMIIKECLRLFPPFALTAKKNTRDVHVDGIGHLKKDSLVGLSFYNLHRWKHIWGEDANEFNPEHFSPENTEKRHPYAFLPFGGGPKICIGYKVAMSSLKVGLLTILSKYKFTTKLKMEDLKYNFAIIFKLDNGYLVTAHRR